MGGLASNHQAPVTLGILAGGRATRLGGIDKAWLQRGGVPQVLRIARRFRHRVERVIVSANAALDRYQEAGLEVVADRQRDIGPLAGLQALSEHCGTPWLLTLPVDLVDANDCLIDSLLAAGSNGARIEDDDGLQPLLALWPTKQLQAAVESAIREGEFSVQALQERLQMATVRLAGVRVGNLNTPDDLRAAGVVPA